MPFFGQVPFGSAGHQEHAAADREARRRGDSAARRGCRPSPSWVDALERIDTRRRLLWGETRLPAQPIVGERARIDTSALLDQHGACRVVAGQAQSMLARFRHLLYRYLGTGSPLAASFCAAYVHQTREHLQDQSLVVTAALASRLLRAPVAGYTNVGRCTAFPCQEATLAPVQATYANSASTRERSRLGKFGLEGNSELRWTPPVRGRVLQRDPVGRTAWPRHLRSSVYLVGFARLVAGVLAISGWTPVLGLCHRTETSRKGWKRWTADLRQRRRFGQPRPTAASRLGAACRPTVAGAAYRHGSVDSRCRKPEPSASPSAPRSAARASSSRRRASTTSERRPRRASSSRTTTNESSRRIGRTEKRASAGRRRTSCAPPRRTSSRSVEIAPPPESSRRTPRRAVQLDGVQQAVANAIANKPDPFAARRAQQNRRARPTRSASANSSAACRRRRRRRRGRRRGRRPSGGPAASRRRSRRAAEDWKTPSRRAAVTERGGRRRPGILRAAPGPAAGPGRQARRHRPAPTKSVREARRPPPRPAGPPRGHRPAPPNAAHGAGRARGAGRAPDRPAARRAAPAPRRSFERHVGPGAPGRRARAARGLRRAAPAANGREEQ